MTSSTRIQDSQAHPPNERRLDVTTEQDQEPKPNQAAAPLVLAGLDELRDAVGADVGPTGWLVIDQARINAFAEVTGDPQWIQVDSERATIPAFGSTVAHGYLILSLCNLFLPQLIEVNGVSMGVNYGANRARFPAPVKVGSRIRGRAQILACDDVPGGVQAAIQITAEIEGIGKPGCVVETLNRWVG